jgi:hypothetical protein
MMTMPDTPNLFLHVGKPVKDEYGRIVGKIASFAVSPSGKFDAVFIEQGDGKFFRQTVEHLQIDDNEITLISRIKSRATVFCDQIPLIWRKDQALKDLDAKKKISPDLYDELHATFDGALTQLKHDAQALGDEIDKEIARCKREITEQNYALVHLEIEHEIGKIDDHCYETAFSMVQENLKRVHVEKSDLEFTQTKLGNILLGDATKLPTSEKPKITEQPSKGIGPLLTASELPEPPVVVYVKEIGKSSI